MARIRSIKPSFFLHHGLFLAEQRTGLPCRIAFIGLWTCCDREGRFKWRPMELKVQILPYDNTDFDAILDALTQEGFLVKYQVNGDWFGAVTTWVKHQAIPTREPDSVFPAPPINGESQLGIAFAVPEQGSVRAEGNGKEGKGRSVCTEPCSSPSAFSLPLNDGTEYAIDVEELEEYNRLYPAVAIEQSIRNMRGWCISNPQKRKTRSGIRRFITSWLSAEQNKSHPSVSSIPTPNPNRYWKPGIVQ